MSFARYALALCIITVVSALTGGAAAQEDPADILSARLRAQGHRCETPVSAERDVARSKPDEAAWLVKCANANYRMRLVPQQAAIVEQDK
jgi:hypothetical protein